MFVQCGELLGSHEKPLIVGACNYLRIWCNIFSHEKKKKELKYFSIIPWITISYMIIIDYLLHNTEKEKYNVVEFQHSTKASLVFYVFRAMIVKCYHLNLQCTFGLNTAQLLEPVCFFASPKPKEADGNRRALEDSKELFSEPNFDGCRVSTLAFILSCKLLFSLKKKKFSFIFFQFQDRTLF